ncbi:MAG: sugar transferase [Actinomycetota bacterium]
MERRLMRCIDLGLASLLLVALSPVILGAIVAIRSTSHGPVIFRHDRVGRDGRSFSVFKFRTMVDGANGQILDDPSLRSTYQNNGYKVPPGDERITRVGRALRRTSIDEIPQLWNVMRHEMSLVGVRPLVREEFEQRADGDQRLYRMHLPGLTGLWQVSGRSAVSESDRVVLDRHYLETWSVRENLRLLVKTPKAVLAGVGAH